MRAVYFEYLKRDGTVEPRIISSADIDCIRPLTETERECAEKLRSGEYHPEPFGPSASLFARMKAMNAINGDPRRREFFKAQGAVSHASTQSVLVLKNGNSYCLRESVEEIAKSISDLIVLNGDPESAPQEGVILGRPLLKPPEHLLIEHKR